jgi:hypothetical protein
MILIATLAFTPPVAALHDGHDGHDEGPTELVFKVGKTGEIKIGTDVRIGDVLAKKGKYLFTHRVEGDSHILVLTGIAQKTASESAFYEVRMRLVPARNQVKTSALFVQEQRDHSYRVTIVQIAGESGDHIPESVIGD